MTAQDWRRFREVGGLRQFWRDAVDGTCPAPGQLANGEPLPVDTTQEGAAPPFRRGDLAGRGVLERAEINRGALDHQVRIELNQILCIQPDCRCQTYPFGIDQSRPFCVIETGAVFTSRQQITAIMLHRRKYMA